MICTLACDAVLVLVGPEGRTRRYPVPAGTPICDVYVIDGASWNVVAVIRSDAPRSMHFDGACPFLTCLEDGPHDHPVCEACGAVRYGNLTCNTCRAHHGDPALPAGTPVTPPADADDVRAAIAMLNSRAGAVSAQEN